MLQLLSNEYEWMNEWMFYFLLFLAGFHCSARLYSSCHRPLNVILGVICCEAAVRGVATPTTNDASPCDVTSLPRTIDCARAHSIHITSTSAGETQCQRAWRWQSSVAAAAVNSNVVHSPLYDDFNNTSLLWRYCLIFFHTPLTCLWDLLPVTWRNLALDVVVRAWTWRRTVRRVAVARRPRSAASTRWLINLGDVCRRRTPFFGRRRRLVVLRRRAVIVVRRSWSVTYSEVTAQWHFAHRRPDQHRWSAPQRHASPPCPPITSTSPPWRTTVPSRRRRQPPPPRACSVAVVWTTASTLTGACRCFQAAWRRQWVADRGLMTSHRWWRRNERVATAPSVAATSTLI